MNRIALVLILIAVAASVYLYYSMKTEDGPKKMSAAELASFTGHPPTVWGPSTWRLMHIVAIDMPFEMKDEDRRAFSMFIASLAMLLPCANCRAHFQEILQGEMAIQPTDLVDRRSMFDWTIRLHNLVNSRLGKSYSADLDFWFEKYTLMRQQ